MIKVSDLVAEILVSHGLEHVFMVAGGGAMHLNDSLGKHPKLKYICCHHEQACAMAAESYARLTGKIAVVNVTTGPGGINALNGVFGAWTDSIPMIVISGQVRYDTTVSSTGMNLRQLGDQEFANIIDVALTMTKYAAMVKNPFEIKYHIEKAIFLAQNGRPGPVWIDIPMNVQGTFIDEEELEKYDGKRNDNLLPHLKNELIDKIIEKISEAKRPIILAGSGIRLSGMVNEFLTLIGYLKIPVTTAWNAHDLIPDENPYYVGRPGSVGDRAGNFAVQNSDLLLVFGCRLNIRQISYNWKSFAREAYKIVVDIDPVELKKPTLEIDLPINADLREIIPSLLERAKTKNQLKAKSEWLRWCSVRKVKYPVVLDEYWETEKYVNPYCFVQKLTEKLPEDQITVVGDGTACVCTFQAAKIKKGQRLYTNSGCASMGYDLPAAIGACIGSGYKKIVCLAGDGSIQMNIQELATISYNKLPIKIFVLNNNGYHSIRQTQQNYFGEPLVGVGPESGLGFPDFKKLAQAYQLDYFDCKTNNDLNNKLDLVLIGDNPAICEVFLDLEQQFAPKLLSRTLEDGKIVSSPLEDLAPFLSREELRDNMIISLIEDK